MPFLNSAGLCLYPSMSGTTLLSAAESAKGVTFAGHYWGPNQYQPPVQHTSGGGGGGNSGVLIGGWIPGAGIPNPTLTPDARRLFNRYNYLMTLGFTDNEMVAAIIQRPWR